MPAKKYHVNLSEKERQELRMLTRKGVHPTRKVTRARILLLADEERPYNSISAYLHCSYGTVSRICKRYCHEGLPFALHEKPRSGSPGKIHGRFEATLTALACSTPPEGSARWTVRLLADKLVELGLIDSISSTRVWELLERNELKPWQKKQWCIGDLTTEFLWRMENLLALYERPYNSKRPVICFDERPCQLLDDVIAPLPMEPGTPQREDYNYERNGVCSLLIAFEPLRGYRFAQIREHRTKKDYAAFMKELAHLYRQAEQLILVQDNLNTHSPGSFYAAFPAADAFAFAQRFDMQYTPNHASWLNMVEIELSVLSKRCLDRRIGDIKTLEREVLACVKERNERRATVQWRFTKTDARDKFERFYPIDHN
jgi:transposase